LGRIGKEYHKRIHPNGKDFVRLYTEIWGWYAPIEAQEDVPWFINNWINTGIFYDLLDPINEEYDNLQGYSIQNMYNCFGPESNGWCSWRSQFIQHNPNVNTTDLDKLMINQNNWDGICK
jgi:hypothetical protein